MLVAALVLAALSAAVHVYIFVLESLRWEEPATRRVFGTTPEQAATTAQLAFNQGFYNLFLAVGTFVGIAVTPAAPVVGTTLVVMGTASMLAAALVLILTDRTKARPAIVQGLFPALSLVALAVTGL